MSETNEPALKKIKAAAAESVVDTDKTSSSSSTAAPTDNDIVGHEVNDQGEEFFDLTGKKRFTVRKWKGKVLLDIREFYESNGEMKPGKKGISLNLEQYKILKNLVKSGSIDALVKKHGGGDV
mmetsp:Transcript_9242/g.17401  ORF Transcript_9242/g.17401 Transcript_9242/m.17401 type:complete len:123 (-) Transcript_9242:2631-2999(-)